ncbi:MAG: retron system putative HNH endonuclease [Gemmataceae bacterium]
MRKFQRLASPKLLEENCSKWNDQWTELRKANHHAAWKWYHHGGKTLREHILPILSEQTQAHCSFCDVHPVDGASLETIEHFRPKSSFPEQAYSWSNLYYCCDACQNSKREKYDELLLRPDAESYQFQRYFIYDYTTGGIQPNPMSSERDQQQAQKTIELYGLDSNSRKRNRRNELLKYSGTVKDQAEKAIWAFRDYLGLE